VRASIFPRYLFVASSLFLATFLAACGSSSAPVSTPMGSLPAPSTTLQAQIANNTSAADSFTAQTNGNAGAGNISKLPLTSLLYSGATTKIYATWLGWFGLNNHIQVGYNSDTAAQVHAQVEDMISRGMSGVIPDWYGASNTFIDGATMLLKTEAEAHPGFQFAIMEDKGSLGTAAANNGCDVTDQLIADLNYIASNYESSPAYMRINGQPVVFFFGVDAFYIDWNRVLSSVSGNPLVILRGINGLTQATANGGFSWVNIQSTNPFNPELNLQDSFFQAAQNAPQKLAVATAFKGFNDTLATWGTDRVIDQNCGQTWLQSFAEAGKYYSSDNQLPTLQIATWNDYEEGTAIEPGIDNCVYLAPSQSGSTISWTVNGGNENTIDHYQVYLSTDGQSLSALPTIPRGTHAIDLRNLNLSSTTNYYVYIQAIGLPSIQNKMSPPIIYRPGDQPPAVSLNVSQTGDLAYSATISPSSGTSAKATIDFGDGTVVNGTSASHIYKAVGTYLVTATAYDSAGASSVAVQQISAQPSASGTTIVSPANSATVNWPTPLVASAGNDSSVAAMEVLIDGTESYAAYGNTLNTQLKVFTGTHQITVQSLDSSGNVIGSASLNVTAEPTDKPPVAKITLTAMPSISPTTVLGCTAASTDPDGFVNAHQLQYSNGMLFTSPAALETFTSPGTYTATATVTDEFGATNSTSTTFTINGGVLSARPSPVMNQARPARPRPLQPIGPLQ
jgi:PKD domain/Bacterial Ig domain